MFGSLVREHSDFDLDQRHTGQNPLGFQRWMDCRTGRRGTMTYLNLDCIETASSSAFQAQEPYPWAHIQGTLTAEMSEFQRMVGVKRSHGQAPHNRGIPHYREGMAVAEPWQAFIDELHGKAYD